MMSCFCCIFMLFATNFDHAGNFFDLLHMKIHIFAAIILRQYIWQASGCALEYNAARGKIIKNGRSNHVV